MKSDSFSQFETNKGLPCHSVSEITNLIQDCLESTFSSPLQIKGEVSNFTAHLSGHWYFTLKDSACQIRAVMFRQANQKLNFKPEKGESLEVVVTGEISVYKPRGEYQIICHSMEKRGLGALQEQFEKLKIKLKEEGLFEKKRAIPFLPRHIVIISSPTGAAIQDILNILKRRYKGVKITLVPALVQGESAPESLISALNQAKKLKSADVLMITRGGGSLEDLMAFNNEEFARAIFQFPLPVISAVGHEIDFTICDFVADLRAPTPSAGAELVAQNAQELSQRVQKMSTLIHQSLKRELSRLKEKLNSLSQKLISPPIFPEKKIQELTQYIDELNTRLKQALFQQNQLKKEQLRGLTSVLESLSPLKVLSRGYSFVSKNGQIITQAQALKTGEEVHIQFSKSFALARINKTGKESDFSLDHSKIFIDKHTNNNKQSD